MGTQGLCRGQAMGSPYLSFISVPTQPPGAWAETAPYFGLSVPPPPHSHPGPHWEKSREGGQEMLGPVSR